MTRLEVRVRGLHCAGCERSIEAAVRRLDGVVSAKVSILVQVLSLVAALGYLAALLPPRWLRPMSQLSIG
jgi:copper chaperone CopZ